MKISLIDTNYNLSLSNDRYEEIKRIVVELFEQYNVKCVPVSGFELALKMGIKVIPYSSIPKPKQDLLFKKSTDGFLVEKNIGEFYIFYNDNAIYGRINHTILHEIGHIVLDHTEDSELADKEVSFFAKYALVPPVLIHKFKINNVLDIVKVFDVSLQAACYAYSYYQKWLQYGTKHYTDYEIRLLNLFNNIYLI